MAIEPMLGTLSNSKNPDFEALRATLPAAKKSTRKGKALTVEDVVIVEGSLSVQSGVTLTENAMLVVLGDLSIRGGLWSDAHTFTMVLVGGKLDVDKAYTSGEALVFGGIVADLWWGIGNDHSTYSPALTAQTYVAAEDRGDIVGALKAKTKIVGFDVSAKIAKKFPGDPRTLIGGAKARQAKTGTAKVGEIEALRAELAAMWAMQDRISKVKAMRAIYARIAKQKLADAGVLLVEMIETKRGARGDWSLQDELQLLAKLGRDDLLQVLPADHLDGYEGWMPNLLMIARKARG